MYAYFKGKVEEKGKNYIILDNNNIGYLILMTISDIEKLEIGNTTKVYTYLNVKEDEMSLHGFLTPEKLTVFKKLIEVSGVGPRVGKNILDQLTSEEVCVAIATSDIKTLVKVSGVGNKMAQRIILELKDKISNEQIIDTKTKEKNSKSNDEKEATIALQVLGYTQKQAEEAVDFATKTESKLESIIKVALKYSTKL
ncbi:MAG: Holliday junction branch migration protein RuvA [Clostridia bacterium]